ncbi:hypothetical protein DSO57_1010068 [Entomophthora muscae]|uniref:Uncharacterized protein n=1 Tax=Entomophthora muscae TaxID=34485 RepID=A0ACC2SJZ2_9FUNG|nr:hypothetical protein DSO57_1010068 [Entomophthora muscae]
MIWVWTCSLPVTTTNSAGNSVFAPIFGSFTDFLAVFMFITGTIVETVADIQKFAHRESKPKPLDILRSGVWKYSRHPNYFGEILLWWGIYLLCLPVTSLTGVYAVASPIFITWLLLFVSGIPLSEPTKEKKFVEAGEQAAYQEYIDSTSAVVPLPNDFYRSLPGFVKSTILMDFPIYRYKGVKTE